MFLFLNIVSKYDWDNFDTEDFDNPWLVGSIQDFTCLKCPECLFWSREEYDFQGHALENHPLSVVFFGNDVKEEPFDANSDLAEFENCEDFIKNENNPLDLSKNHFDPDYSPNQKKSDFPVSFGLLFKRRIYVS